MELLELFLLAYAGAALVVQGIAIVLAYGMTRVEPGGAPPVPAGRVAVVIAARNEAEAVGGALDDLARQTYRDLDVVVVDGGSTDGTREVASARTGVRVLEEPPLPPGWVGKNWACVTGARATDSPYVLFLDADVRLHPGAIAAAVGWAEKDRADLVTFGARIVTVGFWERVVLPFYTQMVLTYFRASRVNREGSRSAVANGQFLLVRRASYDAVGGHGAIAGVVLEDVALARRFRSAGRRLRFGWAPDLVSTRMYQDRHEMFEGLLKTIHDTEFRATRQIAFIAALLVFFLGPLLILPIGWRLGDWPVIGVGAFLWVALFVKHAGFSKGIGGRARDGLAFPLAVGFYLTVLVVSLVRGLRGKPVTWKGREYPIAPPTA
ncbi:MAG: glycosyltransferase [Thermoplasmata archaeon]|nr:glycosyltransferase [Thermoplasmata archaeon]